MYKHLVVISVDSLRSDAVSHINRKIFHKSEKVRSKTENIDAIANNGTLSEFACCPFSPQRAAHVDR